MVLYSCILCKKDAIDPRLLACNHVFCFKCIRNHFLNTIVSIKKNTVICPECQKPTAIKNPRKILGSKKLSLVMNLDTILPAPVGAENIVLPAESVNNSILASPENSLYINHQKPDYSTLTAAAAVIDCCHEKKDWTCGTCGDWFCEQCVDKHFEKLPPATAFGKEHEIYNPWLCLYCSQQKSWHCATCDRPFCPTCMIDHVDKFQGHRVEKIQGVYDVAPSLTPDVTPSAPPNFTYYSQPPVSNTDVVPKFPNDPNYRPPAFYAPAIVADKVDYYDTAEQLLTAGRSSDSISSDLPSDVSFVCRLISEKPEEAFSSGCDRRLKKFCIDEAGQIFAIFCDENGKSGNKIPKYDFNTGRYLSSIELEDGVEILDIDYDEKNELILALAMKNEIDSDSASASVSGYNFLLKYSVYDSTLMDVYDLPSSENFRFLTIDKKSSSNNKIFLATDNGLKTYNCENNCEIRRFQDYCSNETLKSQMTDLIAIDSNDKGSIYLLFKNTSNESSCSLTAFHSLPIPVLVPLPCSIDNVTNVVVSRNNVVCFASPNLNRILIFHKNRGTKEFALDKSNVCHSNGRYSWRPTVLHVYGDQLLIYDDFSKSFYKWKTKI